MEEKTEFLNVRISSNDLATFKQKVVTTGKVVPVMVREMVTAFNDDRLKIIPTDDQKQGLKIYDEER